MKKIIAGLLMTSLLLTTTPLLAAGERDIAPSQQSQTLRASIDRAIALAAATDMKSAAAANSTNVAARGEFVPRLGKSSRAELGAGQVGTGGGGGGHAMAIVWTLIGTAVSVGTTVYYLKYMRKTIDEANAQGR